MPRGVSREKHPELYGDKPTKAGIKKGTRKLGTKAGMVHQVKGTTETLTELSMYLTSLASLINQLPKDSDTSVLFNEFSDVADIMVAERKKLFPNIEEPANEAPATPAQAAPPAFVPPPAPSFQPHA